MSPYAPQIIALVVFALLILGLLANGVIGIVHAYEDVADRRRAETARKAEAEALRAQWAAEGRPPAPPRPLDYDTPPARRR